MTLIRDASLSTEPIKRAKISVRGIVQGVGFRPFVYQLAFKHGLKGWVCNTSGDVKIEVEGSSDSLQLFLDQLKTEAPPLALIEEINHLYVASDGDQTFEIRESKPEKGKYQRISPDIATCPLCLKKYWIETTGGIAILLPTVPTVGPGLLSSRTFLMTDRKQLCEHLKCARNVKRSMTILLTGAFTLNPIAVPHAGRNLKLLIRLERRLLLRILFVMFVPY